MVFIEDTELKEMNELLRSYGKFHAAGGKFSIYSEFAIKNNRIDGYIKPFFTDIKVGSNAAQEHKSVFKKIYEKIVGGVAKLMENRQKSVATRVEISGSLESPDASPLQAVVGILKNAFIKSLLPGFDTS